MKRIVFCLCLCGVILGGCRRKTIEEVPRHVAIFLSTRSLADVSLKSTASAEESLINKLKLFGVDNQGNIVESIPVIHNPPQTVLRTISPKVGSLYAIANPSADMEDANPTNVSDLMSMTGDFSTAPQSPFLMSGIAVVGGYNVNVEMVRSVAKIVVIGEDGFIVQSVAVRNTPETGFVFRPPTLTAPSSARVNYPETTQKTVYVAENTTQSPTRLIVKGTFEGRPNEVNVNFTVDGRLVNIIRNTSYSVAIGMTTPQDCNITITISDWDDQEIDKHYFDND